MFQVWQYLASIKKLILTLKKINTMEKIAIFFGPLNGSVHRVAKMVAEKIGTEKVDLIHIGSASTSDLEKYSKIIFGISTIGKDTWQQKFDKQ
jgi:flavodoxin I